MKSGFKEGFSDIEDEVVSLNKEKIDEDKKAEVKEERKEQI